LTRANCQEKAVIRQGPTSIYYTFIIYAGATPEQGPWEVEVYCNDVNWEFFPRTDDFSQEFTDLDDALQYANGEDDREHGSGTAVLLAVGTSAPVQHEYRIWSQAFAEGQRAIPELETTPGSKRLRRRHHRLSPR
jgi:hypothetical protein